MLQRRDGNFLCHVNGRDDRCGDGLLLLDDGVLRRHMGNLGRDGRWLMLDDQRGRWLEGSLRDLSGEGDVYVDNLGDEESRTLGWWVVIVWRS